MKTLTKLAFFAILFVKTTPSFAEGDSSQIQGTYQAVLTHEKGNLYQFANITLRTVNPGDGSLKISANVKIYFGDWNSNEFLTFEYPDVPLNILTRQLSMRNDDADVTLVGNLRSGEILGDWYASAVGRVGTFVASKTKVPDAPKDGTLIKMITGFYKGQLTNENPDVNLPENVALSLVTSKSADNTINVTGSLRLYLGDFGSKDYVETKLSSADFNFYSRFLTLKTQEYGITIKGQMSHDGKFVGDVFADGYGKVGPIELKD